METKISEIQQMVPEAWVRHEAGSQEQPAIQPVGKSETISRSREGKRGGSDSGSGSSNPDAKQSAEMMAEVQSYLQDLNIQLKFEIHEKTGEMIVKVLDRDTGDVIRQIPPESLVRLRDSLEELRGVLFNGEG